MKENIVLFIVGISVQVMCQNEFLRGEQPLYGITTMISGLNSSCFKELDDLRRGVEEGKVWALKALDASGRPASGWIYGNNLWIGSHFQCTEIANRRKLEVRNDKIAHLETPYDFPPFPMGFTMVYFRHNSTFQYHTRMPLEWIIQVGICLPSSCNETDVKQLSQKYVEGAYMAFQKLYNVSLEVTNVRKLTEDPVWIYQLPKTIVLLAIFSGIIILVIVGTVFDVKQHNLEKINKVPFKNNFVTGIMSSDLTKISSVQTMMTKISPEEVRADPSLMKQALFCFSIYSNVKSFVRTKIPTDSIGVIHGLRFLSMGWVILVHAVFFQGDFVTNVPMVFRKTEGFVTQTFTNSTYAVDTYLFLSGFLLGYIFLKSKSSSVDDIHKNPPKLTANISHFCMIYINRFLRLTPTYMLVLLLTNVLYTYFSKTSALLSSEKAEIVCDKYWWRNLLYINNLYPRSEMCMSWSWYLSLDTQFFTIGLLLLILSTTAFTLSAVILVVMIILHIVLTAYKCYNIGYIPTMDDQLIQLDAIYDLPWNRIGPYLVGIITAYLLVVKLQNKLELKKSTRLLLWVIFPSINLWIVFTLYTRQISVEFSAFYIAVSRPLWAVGLAWLLIACTTGNARLLEKFLSFRGYIPLSRLTYCAYLLNPLIVTMMMMRAESPFESSIAAFALSMLGTWTITFLTSFLFSMLFELPFIRLTKLMMEKMKKKPKISPEEQVGQQAA